MEKFKFMVLPLVVGVFIIISLFIVIANMKSPYVECNLKVKDSLGIVRKENVRSNFKNNYISNMEITKTYIFPNKYNKNIKSVYEDLDRVNKYLGNSYSLSMIDNKIILKIKINKEKPIILDNIRFYDQNGFSYNLNYNTKAIDALSVSVGDLYDEIDFTLELSSRGYSCK